MTEEHLKDLIRPHLGKGVFINGEFDLDVYVDADAHVVDWNRFGLWTGDDTNVMIDLPVTAENARLIQKAVESLGHRLLHTWGQQYAENIQD